MSKFKIGDRVITHSFDSIFLTEETKRLWSSYMKEFEGKEGVIKEIIDNYYVVHGEFLWPESTLTLVEEKKDIPALVRELEALCPERSGEIRELWPEVFRKVYNPEHIYIMRLFNKIYKLAKVKEDMFCWVGLLGSGDYGDTHKESGQDAIESISSPIEFTTFHDFVKWLNEQI